MGGRGNASGAAGGGGNYFDGREVTVGDSLRGKSFSSPNALMRTLEGSGYDVTPPASPNSYSGDIQARWVRDNDPDESGKVHEIHYTRDRSGKGVLVDGHTEYEE